MKRSIAFLLLGWFALETVAQNSRPVPHLSASAMKNGLIVLAFKESWKYQKGDDLEWKSPKLNDSAWQNLDPDRLLVRQLADDLWQGYGWWRLRFTVDSALCPQLSRLHFRSWGAAEVYLDGQLISSYGKFSTRAEDEKNYVPRYVLDNTIKISPAEEHLLAVRFSNHQALKNEKILRHNAPFAGFSIGLANEEKAANAAKNYAFYVSTHSIVTVLLILLMLLHLVLFFRFPKDSSNLAIIGVMFLFLISIATNYASLFFEITSLSNTLLRGIINSAAFGLGLLLLPYTLSLIFRLENLRWTRHLVWIVGLRSVLYFFPVVPIALTDSVLIALVLFTIGYILFKAKRLQKRGLMYLTIGAIGTTVFILIDRLYATKVIALTDEQFYVVVVFTFISFPVSLSLYITSRYGDLFSSMEKEVADRTAELNRSLTELTTAQVALTAKNAENVLLLKEIHHRVKNNLQTISSLLSLQSAHLKDDSEVRGAVEAGQHRVQSMALIHQKLYQRDNLAAIEMRDYLANLGESLFESYGIDEDRISLKIEMPELELDVDTAVPVGLIVNELVTNSLKYAFPNGRKGVIKIALEKRGDGLELRVADDGVGLSEVQKTEASFGTRLIDLLAMQLGGNVERGGGANGFWTRLTIS